VVIETTAEKVRHPRPFRSCFVPIKFDYGIDDIAANVDFLFDCRSDKTGELLKSAKSIEWEDKIESMDREDLIAYIEANKLKKELRQRVIDKWEAIEADIKTERVQKYGGEE
jgi:hypothetical protein